jgi:hypothetical protein
MKHKLSEYYAQAQNPITLVSVNLTRYVYVPKSSEE